MSEIHNFLIMLLQKYDMQFIKYKIVIDIFFNSNMLIILINNLIKKTNFIL
jgi:hypothetical protein